MSNTQEPLRERLFRLRDPGYREFQCRLMPTVDRETVIGVRTPELRRLAKELGATPDAEIFLRSLPHHYYEEYNLHSCLIGRIRQYDACVAALDAFLPYVDNWATCDMTAPRALGQDLPALRAKIGEWLSSGHTYTVRFGIASLMRFFLDGHFNSAHLAAVAEIRSEEYYVRMMVAWYFATALAKQYDAALPYLELRRLEPWTHNKTIQKAIESYRIPDARKARLRELKIR